MRSRVLAMPPLIPARLAPSTTAHFQLTTGTSGSASMTIFAALYFSMRA